MLLALAGAPAAPAQSLEPLIARPDLWQTPRADFVAQNHELGFRWISEAGNVAQSTQPGLTLFDNPVYQAIARFEGDRPKQLTLSLYNRGDAGDLPREKFEALQRMCVEKMTALAGSKPVVRGKDAGNAVKAEGVSWRNDASVFLLEYSFTREVKTRDIPYRAEFMRLEVTPADKPQSLISSTFAAQAPARFEGASHVKRAPSGDVVIEGLPMVDQGEKGYCVVASAERVMRYYGAKVDEHELAQIANTSAAGGTSNEAMFEALKKLSNRLRVKIRSLEAFDVKRFVALIEDYNRLAKRGHRAAEIDISNRQIDAQAIYAQMKPELLREVRTRNKSEASRFFRDVQMRVDEGVPPLWSVMLGVVPEEKAPPGVGGHMRLITGYNAQTSEIIYSDSWGLGHEAKRMALDDAWTITTGLNSIEPL